MQSRRVHEEPRTLAKRLSMPQGKRRVRRETPLVALVVPQCRQAARQPLLQEMPQVVRVVLPCRQAVRPLMPWVAARKPRARRVPRPPGLRARQSVVVLSKRVAWPHRRRGQPWPLALPELPWLARPLEPCRT